MGRCKYCGQSTGIFGKSHQECEDKHTRGINGMKNLMFRYFEGSVPATHLRQKIEHNKVPYYLNEDDIADVAAAVISAYGDELRRPYSLEILSKIKAFLSNVGVSYAAINKEGALDELAQKLFQGYLIDFFVKNTPISQIKINTESVLSVLPLNQQRKDEAYINVLNKAADKFMLDGTLTEDEYQRMESYTSLLGISIYDILSKYKNETLARIGQAVVLKDLQKGLFPHIALTVPVILGKGERTIWVYDNVSMYQEKILREYVGGSRGVSIRIFKGVSYRIGSFKGRPVEKSNMEHIGTGTLIITNKHFFFHCATTTIKIPFSKLIGVIPYSDGIEIHTETKVKRAVFQGFDAWFIMNVLNQVNNQ